MTEVEISIIVYVEEKDEWVAQKKAKEKLISNIEECRSDGALKDYVNNYFKSDVIQPESPSWARQQNRPPKT